MNSQKSMIFENLTTKFSSKTLILLTILAIMLAGCQQEGQKVELSQPFLGGTTGISFDFSEFRPEVFDAGTDPFDIVLKIENTGEADIQKDKIRIALSGINPLEFATNENKMTTSPVEDIIGTKKDIAGNIQAGPAVFVEFKNLNHQGKIVGAQIDYPIRADICYLYNTQVVSKLCMRKNILTQQEGICNINEDKPVFNSGAPIQITKLSESARAKDKIGFTFEIRNMGTGEVFERGTVCDRMTRKNKDKVFVRVETNTPGLTCTGLDAKGTYAEGFTTLFDGVKTITCTQPVLTGTDYEQVIGIEAHYDYNEFKQTKITVKNVGE